MEFADFAGPVHFADDDHHIDLRNPHFRREPTFYSAYANPDIYAHHAQNPHYAHHLAGLAVDVKPRLTKEQHDILEAHYQHQNKPNTQTKKGFAETLGVSLDKVNNWFQNRRAKSKQDAKKQAGGMMQNGTQPQLSVQTSSDDLSAQFLSSEYFSPHNDSAVGVDPMALSNGLGISRDDSNSQASSKTAIPTTMSPQDMVNKPAHSLLNDVDSELHRRTLTQEDFNSFAHGGDYTVKPEDGEKTIHQSPVSAESSDFLNEFFPELTDNFGSFGADEVLGSAEMQPVFSTDSYGTTSSSFSEAPSASTVSSTADETARNLSTHSTTSDWSEHSTPSLSLTPAMQQPDSAYAASDDLEISPRGKVNAESSEQWQPGQSVPVDFTQMEREFREAASRSASQLNSANHSRNPSAAAFVEQPLSYPEDQAFTAPAEPQSSLAQSMGNMEIGNSVPRQSLRSKTSMSSMSGAGSIAARRQRPRPQPLSSSSLRSASYCGALPTAPGIPTNNNLAPQPTLRRIKSSNVMNGGIANGRIQKNIGGQRSPMNFTFADAVNSPKFSRRVSSYSPANGMPLGSAGMAPHTPLSPTELSANLQRQLAHYQQSQPMARQQSLGESIDENGGLLQAGGMPLNNYTSPPATPMYAAQYMRNRLGMLSENTPPQSAPATQQCFPNGMFSQAPQMQATMSQAPMMTSQGPAYIPVMANEYPQMPNIVMPSQPLHGGAYLEMMAAQQQYAGMNQMIQGSQPLNYANMQYMQSMNGQQITPPNSQYPFVPSSPGVLMSQQGQYGQKSMPSADFFVHEYSPPQEMKRIVTPRKAEASVKSYTFANHGPEHFEKSKSKDLTSSPRSSTSGSSSA